jgi:hypothetical protein
MKMRIKNTTGYFLFAVALCMMMISGCSLFYPKPTHDPLTGFHAGDFRTLDANKAITDDYKDYIQILSPEERERGSIFFYEDGTGQHAVEIKYGLNGNCWEHILIYDKDNKRIKAIKYISGNYGS